MQNKTLRFSFALVMTLVLALTLVAPTSAGRKGTLDLQLLAINDFHGQLEPPSGSGGRVVDDTGATINVGGIEYLGTLVKGLQAENPNTLFLGGGDLIGASPLVSGLFHDEPTIEALSLLGMDFSTAGNHEFDEGWEELLRMQYGGCHPVDGCVDGDPFYGAAFKYLTANVIRDDTGETLFRPYKIVSYEGVRVGLIGVDYEETPTIVTPSGVAGLTFLPELETINKYAAKLKRMRVQTIIVLLHNGGAQSGAGTNINTCSNLTPAFQDMIKATDPEVDVFITGHTHNAYNCNVDGRLVTSAASAGRVVTDIDLTIDRKTGDVTAKTAINRPVLRTVALDPEMTALYTKYYTASAPIANRVIGTITADITRTANTAGESALGDVIADAQLWYTTPEALGGSVIAMMNSGGIRADLTYAQISGGELPGQVTYGEAFTVQPFSNTLVSMSMTGEQIDAVLEQQFDNPAVGQKRILQIAGITYSFSAGAPTGSKIDPASIMVGGVPIDLAASYRITVNSFLADGGDNYPAFKLGTDRTITAIDTDAFAAYMESNSPVAPGLMNRITMLP